MQEQLQYTCVCVFSALTIFRVSREWIRHRPTASGENSSSALVDCYNQTNVYEPSIIHSLLIQRETVYSSKLS